MPTRADYAKIHIAKKELGMSDDEYRDVLHWKFQVSSSKELSDRQVTVLINHFRTKGWRPKSRRKDDVQGRTNSAGARDGGSGDNFIRIKPGPAARRQKYILALWNALGYDVDKLHKRCKKQFGIDRFEWVDGDHDLFILITDLRERCYAAGIDPEAS